MHSCGICKYTYIYITCLLLYVLATPTVISGRVLVLTYDSAHSGRLCSVAPLGNQAVNTTTRYPIHSHYPYTVSTSPCPVLIMQSTSLGNWQVSIVYFIGLTRPRVRTHDLPLARSVVYRFGHRTRSTYIYIYVCRSTYIYICRPIYIYI